MSNEIQVLNSIKSMYKAFMENNQMKFDLYLDESVTTWETNLPELLLGKSELDKYRNNRDASGQRPSGILLEVSKEKITVINDFAVARYLFKATMPGAPTIVHRVTDVLVYKEFQWKIIHHHSQIIDN